MEFEEVENIGQRIKEIRKSKSITIQKLSQFTDLLSPSGEERTLIRQEEQQLYEYDEYKLQIRRLDFGKKRGIYEFSTYDPETKDTPPSWGLHPYAEVGVILEGKMEVNLDGTVYLLGPGDSIYIKPNLYHTMRNAGDTPCRSFWHLQIMDDSV